MIRALLPGPALIPWLARELSSELSRDSQPQFSNGPAAAGLWVTPLGGDGRLGRLVLRDLLELERELPPADGLRPLDLLVVLTSLADDAWPAAAATLRPGGLLVELAPPPPWSLRELMTPRRRLHALRWTAETRARIWLRAGLFGLRQWSPVDPPGLLVTAGRRRAGGLLSPGFSPGSPPGSPPSSP